MENSTLVRRIEPFFLVGIAILYIIRRLVQEVSRLDDMINEVQQAAGNASFNSSGLTSYHYVLNNNLPLIVGIIFFLVAWYLFHELAYPRLIQNPGDEKAWMTLTQAAVLIIISSLCYHYLKLYVRFRYDSTYHIIGLKVYSLYRVRTVLADAIGLGIILFSYELLFQLYAYLNEKRAPELEVYTRAISYVFLAGAGFFFVMFALQGYIPQTLWSPPFHDTLTILSLFIIVYFLQAYCFTYILPNIRDSQPTAISIHIAVYLLIGLISTIVLFKVNDRFYFGDISTFLLTVYVASFSVAYVRRVMNREKTVLQTQVSTKSAELASLRAQINPHFLFNALNSLYATALKENSEKTADGIQKLGDMMRFMLQENNRERIPLSKEIEYLHNYIQLQRMRLDESHGIEIRVTIQEPDRDIYLAPMMLIPFVENAFKHGISLRNPSWIYVTLTLDATRLYFKVHNSLHARHANDPEEDKSGVGLNNVQKRLELIYPGRHELAIQQSDQDYFVALTLGFW